MEKTSKLLLHQNVTTIKLIDYQIIVAKPWLPDRSSVMTALSEHKLTILEPINGMMLLNSLLLRKSFMAIEEEVSAFAIICLTDYSRRIYYYSVASTLEAAFVIGGYDGDSYLDVIAQFQNNQWSRYGNLQKRRAFHGSITSGSLTNGSLTKWSW